MQTARTDARGNRGRNDGLGDALLRATSYASGAAADLSRKALGLSRGFKKKPAPCGEQTVPVRVHCPHCITPCEIEIAEKPLGVPIRCPKCRKMFVIRPTVFAGKPPSTEPIPETAGPLRLDIAGFTSVGRARSRNEDSFLVTHLTWSDLNHNHQLALVIVADGMGGHAGGDQAARLALRTIGAVLIPLLTDALGIQRRKVTRAQLAGSIDAAITKANRVVQKAAAADQSLKGMGATAAVVIVWNGRAVICHVGNRMVDLGRLTPAEAVGHPAGNEVLQAIGTRSAVEPARHKLKLSPGDWLLVCCDGLHGQVDDRTIQATLSKAPPSAPLLAGRLVDLADQSGGADNCTVVAVRCY
jgi:PPM family protein phosphatase